MPCSLPPSASSPVPTALQPTLAPLVPQPTLRTRGCSQSALTAPRAIEKPLWRPLAAGSAGSGYVLTRSPEATGTMISAAAIGASLLAATVLLPGSGIGVSALFCAYFAMSSLLGIAITASLEERGRQLGCPDDVAALQVFFWTCGFAVGGLVAVVANSGTASVSRQQAVMAVVGALNLCYAVFFTVSSRGETS